MEQNKKDALIIAATLNRLTKENLPRTMSLKKKVDSGETLSEYDLKFLHRILDNAADLNAIVERNPEYMKLRSKAVGLVNDILEKSAQNENP